MKKILVLTMLFLAAGVCTTLAGKKDKKDKKIKAEPVAVAKPVTLTTPSDTTSYAAGLAVTEGLQYYLQQNLHVDTAHIADFIRGYNDALGKVNDPAYVAYMAGSSIAQRTVEQILPNVSRELVGTDDSISAAPFHAGFLAGVRQDTTVFKLDKARELFQGRAQKAREKRNSIYKKENEQWLKNNATKPGVVTTASGLQYKVLKEGNGPKPKATDKVDVIYEGKTINGKVFDATANHPGKKNDSFRCDQVIKGWTEALTNMPVGSKWEIYIPQNLAYGEREAGQIKPYSTLIFTVELVDIEPEAKPAATTADKTKTADKTTAKTAAKTSTKTSAKAKTSTKKK